MPSCRTSEGGTPLCRLGGSCKSVEIRGRSLYSIIQAKEKGYPQCDEDELTREYELLIVLESPGKLSDKMGMVGQERSIDKIIEFIGKTNIKPYNVFVTYLTRCHPPKRKPTVQELKSCMPHIRNEIQELKPKAIMVLGNGTLRLFKLQNAGGINALRGKVFDLKLHDDENNLFGETYKVIPSYDPGIFYHRDDAKLEYRVLGDYRTAGDEIAGKSLMAIDNIWEYRSKFKLTQTLSDVDWVISEIQKAKFFAFDTESRSLPWYKEPMICMSFCWGYEKDSADINCAVVPIYKHKATANLDWQLEPYWKFHIRNPEWQDLKKISAIVGAKAVFKKLKAIFEDESIPKAAHNMKYDINVLRRHAGIRVKGFLYDTMLMHHVLNEYSPHGLEYLSDIEFNIGDYSAKLHAIVGRGKALKKTYDHIPDNILWPYAANDAECCYRLSRLYYNALKAKPHLWKLYCEEPEKDTRALAEAEWMGHAINSTGLILIEKDFNQRQEALLKQMKSKTTPSFNPASPDHVKNAIIKAGYGDRIADKQKAKGFNTSKEVLGSLKKLLPLAGEILEYRNGVKIKGTYIDNVKADLDEDGRIRYSWLIHGTETGRLSGRFFHQAPRVDLRKKHNLRDILVASPGHKLVYFDYSQIELRVFAILAEEKEMLRLLEDPKEDIHTATASEILGIPEEKITAFNRQVGKDTNFAIIYGSEGFLIVKMSQWEDPDGVKWPMTWDMFNRGMARFRERFPDAADYLDNIPNLTNGVV